ncbi:MAG: penicillin-binding protein activator LpoB [Bdellovibrionales bacterium RBG_16_40_8]|nr:MAG: penicillin-binding protein activator LpoB [Bdellovibrionales bacterium RBG_16_40_8]
MSKSIILSLLVGSAFSLSSCAPKAFVRGSYDENVNSENLMTDQWSETDMQGAVKTLVSSALRNDAVANAKRTPIVMVTKLQNKTSEHIDTQSITDMITVELTNSGRVQFVDKSAREDIAEEYEYQDSGTVSRETKKGKGKQVGADLILNGRIDSIVQEVGKNKSVYYKITLNMTNLSTGLIVWTDQKQIRKLYKKQSVGL